MSDPDDRKPRREALAALRRCQNMVSLAHLPSSCRRRQNAAVTVDTSVGRLLPMPRRRPALPSQGQRNLFSAWAMPKLGAPPLPNHPFPAARPPRMMTALDRRGAFDHPPSYLTSVTSIPDTANRKSTPWPTPVRLMTTPLSFCMVVAAAPPPTVMPAGALAYFPSKSATFFK
jgi:hypothetical protein